MSRVASEEGSRPARPPREDDVVQPFQIEASSLRGRLVRLGPALDEVLSAQPYPEPVARMLAELVTLAVLLASGLKYDGIFTLQTRGDGPIRFAVADVTSTGDIRGYAQVDAASVPEMEPSPENFRALLGQGHLAFTVDQGRHTQRYQGIVELTGRTLSDCARHYFHQSEQLDVGLKLAVAPFGGSWRAGALMVQRLPDPARGRFVPSDREDDWRRAMVLMESATDAEMLDPGLAPNRLLFRLFHEDGVRVFAPKGLQQACRCSRERVERTLRSFPRAEIEDLRVDGRVQVTCEFCGTRYELDDHALDRLYGEPEPPSH